MEQSLNTFLYLQVCHTLVTLSLHSDAHIVPRTGRIHHNHAAGRCARGALCKIIARYRNNIRTPRQIRSGTWRPAQNQVTTAPLLHLAKLRQLWKLLARWSKQTYFMCIFGSTLSVLRYFCPSTAAYTSLVDKYFPFSTTIGNSTRQVGFSEFE